MIRGEYKGEGENSERGGGLGGRFLLRFGTIYIAFSQQLYKLYPLLIFLHVFLLNQNELPHEFMMKKIKRNPFGLLDSRFKSTGISLSVYWIGIIR